MDTPEIAVRVSEVYKDFRLPGEKLNSLKSHIVHPFKRRSSSMQHALKDVNLEVKAGEFFGIVGRNGSGKSTLLKIIAGIYQPTKGKLEVAGKLVPFIELGVGFNPELTGQDNVYLNGALLGFSRKEVDAMYDDIVEFAELGAFMGQKLKNYSSGMQVRLAFSMAVRAKADVLLIDEVLAVGDADFQRKCFNYFSQLKNAKTTVIFVSHNMDAVREYCDRAMLIDDSKVVITGQTDKVAEAYMRLFNDSSAGKTAAAEEDRWGDGSVKITDMKVSVEQKTVTLTETVKANKAVDAPIIGFRISDAAGTQITGTNNKVEGKKLPAMTKGQKLTLTWTIPNIFHDGDYTVDPAVLLADEITVADWWNGAASFSVRKNRHLPYVIDPGFSLSIGD